MEKDSGVDLTGLYQKYIEQIETYLDYPAVREPFENVIMADISEMTENPYRFGVVERGRSLILSKEYKELADGILLREAFAIFLPEAISSIPQAYDLCMYYAYLNISKEKKKRWMDIWIKISPPIKILPNIYYNAPYSFPIFDELASKQFLREIMRILRKFDDYSIRMSQREYLELIEEFMTRYTPKFSKSDILLLQELSQKPNANLREIALSLNISISAVSNILNKLKRWHILARRVSIGISSFGLTYYFIYACFQEEKHKSELVEKLRKNPFTYQIYHILDDDTPLLIFMIAPNSNAFVSKLDGFLNLIRKKYHVKELYYFIAEKYARFYNFSSFLIDEKRWNTNFHTWYLWTKRIIEQEKSRIITFPFIKIRKIELPFNLTNLDMEIIDYIITTNDLRVASLRKRFKKGTNVIVKKLKNYFKYGLLKHHVMLQNIGPNDIILFLTKASEDDAELYKYLFDFLPFNMTFYVRGSFNACLSILKLPTGTASDFLLYSRRIFKGSNVKIFLVDPSIGSYWRFPKDLWNPNTQSWRILDEIFK
ncbi:MAG: winged helix-turn-helix domain-containing protein [Candidatus Asgardarchaeia archaeon]